MTASYRQNTLQDLRRADPNFMAICETLVIRRWRRFIDRHVPADYALETGRSTSYPLLRPADVDLMTSWDGLCFTDAWDPRISELALDLVGGEIKAAGDLGLAWSSYADSERWKRSLLVFTSSYPTGLRNFDRPLLIKP